MNLKQKLSKKLKKSGGFTLIEMLIVVAIIAILIAVSIPLVSNALEKARVATDAANERSAKAAALIGYLAGDEATKIESVAVPDADGKPTYNYYYNAQDGKVEENPSAGTTPDGYGQCKDHKGGYLKVAVDTNGDVYLEWSVNNGTGPSLDSDTLMTSTADEEGG